MKVFRRTPTYIQSKFVRRWCRFGPQEVQSLRTQLQTKLETAQSAESRKAELMEQLQGSPPVRNRIVDSCQKAPVRPPFSFHGVANSVPGVTGNWL